MLCVSGVYADKIGIEAAEMLLRNIRHNGCVDEFLQDQVRHLLTSHRTLEASCDLWISIHPTRDFSASEHFFNSPPPQLIIFMALAKGRSRIRTGPVTLHTQTAIHIAEQLTQVCVLIEEHDCW